MMATGIVKQYCVFAFFVVLFTRKCTSDVRFNNVHCKSYNRSLVDFAHCHIKAMNRHEHEVNFKARLHIIVTDVVVVLQFKRKTNGYNQFRREIKFDACEFLQKHNNLILNYLNQMWSKYSNMNHSCPYQNDIIMEGMQMDDSILNWIPFPAGDYAFFSTWYLNGARAMQMDFYFNYS